MALQSSKLKNDIQNIFAVNNLANIIPDQLSLIISDYWLNGTSNLNGKIINIGTIRSSLKNDLKIVYSNFNENSIETTLTSNAIFSAFMKIQLSGGKHGIGGIQISGLSILRQGIKTAKLILENRRLAAKEFSNAIEIFTASGRVFGSGVGPDFVQPFGGLI